MTKTMADESDSSQGRPAADEDIRVNKSGQSLGQKGHRTRQRILQATRRLIETQRGLAPAAAAVAREAGISSPTFYLYFTDVGEAILSVVAQITDEFEPVAALLKADWPKDDPLEAAQAFVQAYFDYWSAHAALLRVRNRLADQGDQRFVTLRMDQAGVLLEHMTAKMAKGVLNGRQVASRATIASVLVTVLERSATVEALELYPRQGPLSHTMDALAFLIARSIIG